VKLAVVTDQISRDLDTACEQVTSWGTREVELRVVGEGPIGADLSPGFLTEVLQTLERWDVRVAGLSPQAFKLALDSPAMRYHRRILLPASLHLAVMLKCGVVHVGAPVRPEGAAGKCPDDALEVLAEAAELAGNLGLTLGLENTPGTWADTGSATAAIVTAVGHHALKATWDPGAALFAGEEPFPAGYQVIRPHLAAVRIRDGRPGQPFQWVLPGDGRGSIPELMTALVASDFQGSVATDPHLSPRLEGARAAYETLEKMLQAARRAAKKAASGQQQ
jgi:sugar phosphate isomerase/epimerase